MSVTWYKTSWFSCPEGVWHPTSGGLKPANYCIQGETSKVGGSSVCWSDEMYLASMYNPPRKKVISQISDGISSNRPPAWWRHRHALTVSGDNKRAHVISIADHRWGGWRISTKPVPNWSMYPQFSLQFRSRNVTTEKNVEFASLFVDFIKFFRLFAAKTKLPGRFTAIGTSRGVPNAF